MRSIRVLAAAAALLTPLVFTTPAAAVDVAQVVGTGTISPGLPQEGCTPNQVVKFTALAAVAVGDHTNTYSFSFSGGSGAGVCESLALGSGTGTLTGGVSGTVNYNRQGSAVSISGTVTVGGDSATILAAQCVFAPTSADPVVSYGLHCTAVLG
ncbi:MAG TPA: hypothetical protein VNQ77_01955 [Frankiaceae bacterium]|nr:hypothetical protein [Frankiaceae bacterium]